MKKLWLIIVILIVILSECLLLFRPKNTENVLTCAKEIKGLDRKSTSLSLIMVGDALIHRGVYYDAQTNMKDELGYVKYDFSNMFTYIKDIIKPYDLKFYNQETVIGGKNLGLSNYPLFNSPDEIGLNLIDVGFNIVNLATNHTIDKGKEGATYSANFWQSKEGIYAVGSYRSFDERNKARIEEKNGITYSVLGYTTYTNVLKISSDYSYLVNIYDPETVKKDIESVRNKVDLLIVSMHWGTEYTNTPTQAQRDIAKYLSSLGVDIIIGHHPHVVESIEYVDNTLVIYSLGNFISAQDGTNKRTGLIAALTVKKNTVNGTSKIKIADVKSDLLWTHQAGYKGFKVIPYAYLTDDILKDHDNLYNKYKAYINPSNDSRIQVGFITKE